VDVVFGTHRADDQRDQHVADEDRAMDRAEYLDADLVAHEHVQAACPGRPMR
jgi:hypothetical protein